MIDDAARDARTDGVERLAAAIGALARPLLLAFDVDGTLAPIVEDPARAEVCSASAKHLRHLRAREGIVIALVTGRDAPQLERMVCLPGVWRVVEHGQSVLRPGELRASSSLDAAQRRALSRFRSWAHTHAVPAGARVEDKSSSVVVHVRGLAAQDAGAAEALLERARAEAREAGLHARDGRAVLEAQAVLTDKGTALAQVIEASGAASCVYVGDDRTDEPAILRASERGIGVFVRSAERPEAPPGAGFVLDGPSEVARLLELLDERLR